MPAPEVIKTPSKDTPKAKKTHSSGGGLTNLHLFPSSHKHKHHHHDDKSNHTVVNMEKYINTEVCFAVRTAFMHDSSEAIQSKTMFEDVDIDGFILCKYGVFFFA